MSVQIGKAKVERDPEQSDFDFVKEVVVMLTAMDRPKEEIREVLAEHNLAVSLEEISKVQEMEADAIREQRAQLHLSLRNLRERYVLSEKLAGIVRDIEILLKKMKEANKFREFAQLMPSLLKSMDMLTRAVEQGKDDTLFSDSDLARVDFEFVKHLEELKYVEIKDEEKLLEYLSRGIDYELLAMRAYTEWKADAPKVDGDGEA